MSVAISRAPHVNAAGSWLRVGRQVVGGARPPVGSDHRRVIDVRVNPQKHTKLQL